MFNYNLFCKRLKLFRELAGYNKYEMSIQANIDYKNYCAIENGKRIPNFRIVITLANALHSNISNFLTTEETPEDKALIIHLMNQINQISDNDTILLQEIYDILLAIKTKRKKNSIF